MAKSISYDLYVLVGNEFVEEPVAEYNQQPEYQGTTINGAIKDYYSFSTNREKVAVLKWIALQPQFVEMKRFTEGENKIFTLNENEYDEILKTGEMPKNLQIAQKFVKNKYDVFLLSNPSNTKSADFIICKKGRILYVEGKTSTGNSALTHRLSEGAMQSAIIVVNFIGNTNAKHIAMEVKSAFIKSENLQQIMLLKGSRLIQIPRQIAMKNAFESSFIKEWVKRK